MEWRMRVSGREWRGGSRVEGEWSGGGAEWGGSRSVRKRRKHRHRFWSEGGAAECPLNFNTLCILLQQYMQIALSS